MTNISHTQESQLIARMGNQAPQESASNLKSATSNVTVASSSPSIRESVNETALEAAADKKHALDSLESLADSIEEAIALLNRTLNKSPTKALIHKDEKLNRFVIRIADKSSGEVIREIPSEAILKFARNLEEMKGLLFDKTL
jgi:flagellar protein FlaG